MNSEYDGMFEWICPECNTKNKDEVDHAIDFTCECEGCKYEFEIYLEVEVNIDKIIKI